MSNQAIFYPAGPSHRAACQTCSADCCLECGKRIGCHNEERCAKSHIINTTNMSCARRLTL